MAPKKRRFFKFFPEFIAKEKNLITQIKDKIAPWNSENSRDLVPEIAIKIAISRGTDFSVDLFNLCNRF
jgi:hypothetical protein